jgi:threonine dehydratase
VPDTIIEDSDLPVRFSDVKAAAKRIKGKATRTALLRSVELDRLTGGRIYVKPECLQLSGSFKFRGAYNRLSQLSERQKAGGVVAYSSGNHGQGVALAANMLDIAATIVMPGDAPKIKIERTASHGARIVFFDRKGPKTREEIGAQIAAEGGSVLVPSYDDPHIIAGQGTSALEVGEDMIERGEALDAYVVPAGGGGLFAGSNLAVHAAFSDVKTYSAEPHGYDDHARSLEKGTRIAIDADIPDSICDALMTPIPGKLTFQINRRFASGGFSVSEEEIKAAMRFGFDYLNLVIEPGGATALAAVLSGKIDATGKIIGLIVTGGNVDPDFFKTLLE